MTRRTHYELLPGQYEFLYGVDQDKLNKDEVHTDIAAYCGGVGSGKTYCGSLRGLLFAFQWPGCAGLVGAMSDDMLENTTKKKYLEHLDNIGMKEGVHYFFEQKKSLIRFLNGSTIRFKTLSNWQQFMSTEYTWIEFEEASFIEEIVFRKLITRLREGKREDWKDYYRAFFIHTNPQGRRGWIYKLFRNKKTAVPGYRCITASTRENFHLGKSYVEMLESLYSEEEVAEMIDGLDLDNDNSVAFPGFTEKNVIKGIEYDPEYPLRLCCDFNYNPMCWYLMQEKNGTWYVLRELIENSVTTAEMCKRILNIIAEYRTKEIIIQGDAHGRDKKTNGSDYDMMLQVFHNAGFRINFEVAKYNPPIPERLSLLRGKVKNAKGEIALYVDSSCKWLLYNFEECKNNNSTRGLKIPTDKEISTDDKKRYLIHPIDAISYPMFYKDTIMKMTREKLTD